MRAVERTCPHCGRTEATPFVRCPHCGGSYFEGPSRRRGWRPAALGLTLVAAGAGTWAALQARAERQARDRAERVRLVEQRKAELRRIQAPRRGSAPELRPAAGATAAERLAARAALVDRVEAAITRDARARARSGELQARVRGTLCGPYEKRPDAVPDDRVLRKRVGRYDCVAVERPIEGLGGRLVAQLGVAFVAAVDFERATWVLCRNNPPQSERGVSVYVRLERACLAATGRALGTGYVRGEDER